MATYVFGGNTVQPTYVSYKSYKALTADLILAWPSSFQDALNVTAATMDITTIPAGINIVLPPANQVGVGMELHIANRGAAAFNVNNKDGGLIVNIAPGLSYKIYLTGNSNAAGAWTFIQDGAGTSTAQAQELAGLGLISLFPVGTETLDTLNVEKFVQEANISFTVSEEHRAQFYVATAEIIVTVPPGLLNGLFFDLINQSNGAVTIVGSGGATIDGLPSVFLLAGQTATFVTDSNNWFVLGNLAAAITPAVIRHVNIPVGGTSITLAPGETQGVDVIVFQGAPTAPITAYIPAQDGLWTFHNAANAQPITVQFGGPGAPLGTQYILEQDERKIIYGDQAALTLYSAAPHAPKVGVGEGGTGADNKVDAFNNLSPATSLGDTIYHDGTNNVRLPIGTNGQGLTVMGGVPAWTAVSGGTVTSVAVTSTDITVGGSPITSSGTITLVLNTVPIAKGGTGQTTAIDAFDALSPNSILGDMTYFDGTNNVRLPVGTVGEQLTIAGGVPTWAAASAGGTVTSVSVTSADITVGGSPITTSGTITLTLNTVSIAKGGTGQITALAAFNALSPLTTNGDLIIYNVDNVRLAAGTAGQVLTMAAGLPSWATPTTGTVTSIAVTSSDITVGGSPITTSGTITLTLNTVSIAKGGTGQTTATAAFNALSPLTTNGDVLYYSTGNNVRLAVGTSGQVLTISAGLPSWATPIVYVSSVAVTSSDITVGGSPITTSGTITLTLNTVSIAKGGTGQITATAAFNALSPTTTAGDVIYFNGTNNIRLAIGTTGQQLTVVAGVPAWSSGGTGTVTSIAVTSGDITVGGSPITSSGTITLTLNTVSIAKGGTGQTTVTAAFNALSPVTATGDIIYFNGIDNVRLAIGTVGQQLTVAAGIPSWSSGGTGTVTSVNVTSADITVGGGPITSSGTITLALNTVSIAKGGTGQITATAAFNALSPLTTNGDIIIYNANNIRLAAGTAGQVLTMAAGLPSWATPTTGTVTSVNVTSSDITVGGSPITSSGTITLTLNTVSIAKGGTGQTTATTAFNALSPLTTNGDIIIYNAGNIRLATGTNGQVLTIASGIPSWATPIVYVSSVAVSSGDLTVGGSPITTSGTITLTLNTVPTTKGGTGLTTYAVGDIPFYNSGSVFNKLAIGANQLIISSNGTSPIWSTRTSLGIAFATSLAGAATYGTTAALTGNTTINTTAVQANSLIMVNPVGDTAGLLGARGYTLGYGSIVAGTSFQIIVNLSGSNNVTVNWLLVNPITT